MNSVHDKLDKVRKPRIHIKYDVETEGATIEKELPFVVGVMGDFAGNNSTAEPKPIRERKYVNIDPDNFDQVMKRYEPGVSMRVKNTLADTDSEMSVDLQFRSMQDFEPASIVEQVPALNELKLIRDQLRDLLTKADRSSELEQVLENALKNNDALQQLASELGIDPSSDNTK